MTILMTVIREVFRKAGEIDEKLEPVDELPPE